MELKFCQLHRNNTLNNESFNRTFMELKLRRERPPRFSPSCFNRTFMELKVHIKSV